MNAAEKCFWTEFLDLYKSMPSLWKVKSREYSNRKLKTKCYEKMVKKLREIDPHANRDRVIKKINVFRTNYKRDLKRKKTTDNFRSSLWYFEKLKFLEEQQVVEDEQCIEENKNYSFDTQYGGEKISKQPASYDDETITETSTSKKRKLTVEDNLLELACRKLINSDETSSILSKGWAIQYQELSKEQQVFTRIIIADVLFHGCLNKITEQTAEDIHKVLKGFSVQNNEHLEHPSSDYIEEYETTTSNPHIEQSSSPPSLEKTETFF